MVLIKIVSRGGIMFENLTKGKVMKAVIFMYLFAVSCASASSSGVRQSLGAKASYDLSEQVTCNQRNNELTVVFSTVNQNYTRAHFIKKLVQRLLS